MICTARSNARGTNSSSALRVANTLWGVGNYVQMGRDLTEKEYVIAINLDHQYTMYENLAVLHVSLPERASRRSLPTKVYRLDDSRT